MATEQNITRPPYGHEQLTKASLEGCYLGSLLEVIERTFEEIDNFIDKLPQTHELGWIREEARLGLNMTHMAQDKAAAMKRLTDDVDEELCARRPQ